MQCVEEVKYYVGDFLQSNIIPAIDGGVVKSDSQISNVLRYEFQKVIARFPRRSRKENESYDGQSSFIIDPFLFAFSWEKTRTLHYEVLNLSDCVRRSGEGKLANQPNEEECMEKERPRYPNEQAWSRRFQFLPFDVKFDNKGEGGSRITSYINDVHPHKHHSFYNTLEKFIDAVLPLFNRSLIAIKAPDYQNIRLHVAVMGRDPLIKKDVDDFRPPEQRAIKTWIDSQGRWQDFIFVDLQKEFWNIGLQMVLHVQDIDLTPQKTNYEGEEWHIQGQRNERLCATAIYVYSALNTTPAKISFRKRVHVEEAVIAKDYIQEPPWASDIYGARHGDPTIQQIGDVHLREGRLVTYPNIFQTRLTPFELLDKRKTGHVKLLILHLVDPQRRMMSTSMVPPQRRDWWADEVRRKNARFWRLPAEIWARIVENVEGYPIGWEEGQVMRREFMAERGEYQRRQTEAMMRHGEWDLEWEDEG